jgi:hypothetical protein
MEIEDLSTIAGDYLRIIDDGGIQTPSIDADGKIPFDCAAAELFKDEAQELAALVVDRRTMADMVPYHFASFGFRVAVATMNLPPREALEEIKTTFARIKSEIRATIDDAKSSNLNMDGKPV